MCKSGADKVLCFDIGLGHPRGNGAVHLHGLKFEDTRMKLFYMSRRTGIGCLQDLSLNSIAL